MREIKFRAWDNKQNKMRNDGFSIYYDGSIQFADSIESKDFILMQYTGLKDKNGKEIYEGDILHIITADMVNLNYKCVVEWSENGYYKDFVNYDMAEVIGNIYENPTLINKE